MSKKPNKSREKNFSGAMDGQIWFLPEKGKYLLLHQVDLWKREDHNDRQAFELMEAMERGEKLDTIVCFNMRGYKYLHMYILGDFDPEFPDKPHEVYGVKIESASVVEMEESGGRKRIKSTSFFEKKTEMCDELGFAKTGWNNSPTEIRYYGRVENFQ